MKLTLRPAQSRLLAIMIALVAMAALVATVVLPMLWLHQRYDKFIDDYNDRLQRYRRVAAQRPSMETAIRAAEKLDSRSYYLKGGSPTLAAAELQGMVTRIVEANQGKIMSSQILPPKDDGKSSGPLKVSLSVQMGAAIIPLQFILHAVETNKPYLFIDQLVVRANQGRGYRPTPGVQPEFVVQLTLHAYAPVAGNKP